jgi:hypothetical protein
MGFFKRPARRPHAKPKAKPLSLGKGTGGFTKFLGNIARRVESTSSATTGTVNRSIRRVRSGGTKPPRVNRPSVPATPEPRRPIRRVRPSGQPGTVPPRPNRTIPTPTRPIRRVRPGGAPKGPITVRRPNLGFVLPQPGERPVRPSRRRWKQTSGRPEGFVMPSPSRLPPGVEAWLDISTANRMPYTLMRATENMPDHLNDDIHTCTHPMNASSWVACIGLVVLENGQIGLYAKFWDGGEIAYIWPEDDTTLWFYQDWKAARSKGKYIRGRQGPSILWAQPYVRLS